MVKANVTVMIPIRVDHVPLMAGKNNDTPGYTALGRLFAIGCLKKLPEMEEKISKSR